MKYLNSTKCDGSTKKKAHNGPENCKVKSMEYVELEGGKGVMCDESVEIRLGQDEEDKIYLCPLKNFVLCKGNIKSGPPKYRCEVQVDRLKTPMESNLNIIVQGSFLYLLRKEMSIEESVWKRNLELALRI